MFFHSQFYREKRERRVKYINFEIKGLWEEQMEQELKGVSFGNIGGPFQSVFFFLKDLKIYYFLKFDCG